MTLCKYISILNEIDQIEEFVLAKPTLKFSNPKNLNDLFECTIPFVGINTEEIQQLIDSVKREGNKIDEAKAKELLTKNRITQDARVCCFNKRLENISNEELFWAHYGDNHKGLCIVYDTEKLLSKFAAGKNVYINDELTCDVFHGKVEYNGREQMKFENDKLTEAYVPATVLFQKNPCWNYENEFRIVLTNNNFEKDNYFVQIDYDCIKKIIFGYRLEKKYKNQICDYYERIGINHISFFSLCMNENADNLIKVPFERIKFDFNKEFNYGRPMRRKMNTLLQIIPEKCDDEKLYEEKLKKEYKFYSRRVLEDSTNTTSYISILYELLIELARINGISRQEVISKIEQDFQKLGDYSNHNVIKELR